MTVDEYVNGLNEPQKSIINRIRVNIKNLFPDSREVISYGVLAYKNNKTFFYCGAFKNHISVFPPLPKDILIEETKIYRNSKDNLIFQVNKEIPYDLINEVAKILFEIYEYNKK
jgi:uncharacterized protein YdhG (YjbR/CyaY superfamily)